MKIKVKLLKSIREKTFGLLLFDSIQPVLFKTRFGIHTFGMNFPIDVIIINKDNVVARIKENLLPNRIFVWPPQFNKVIELPANYIRKQNIKIGDKLELDF